MKCSVVITIHSEFKFCSTQLCLSINQSTSKLGKRLFESLNFKFLSGVHRGTPVNLKCFPKKW